MKMELKEMMSLIRKELAKNGIEKAIEVQKMLFKHPEHDELACEIHCNPNLSRITMKTTYVIPQAQWIFRGSTMRVPAQNIAANVNRFNLSHDSGCLVCNRPNRVSFRMSTYLPKDSRETSIIRRFLEDFFETCSSMYLM